MKKRLRYAMPHVPLYKHRPDGHHQRAMYGTTHVRDIAKRIAEGNKRKRASKPPPEGACGGDIETSMSETETTPLMQ